MDIDNTNVFRKGLPIHLFELLPKKIQENADVLVYNYDTIRDAVLAHYKDKKLEEIAVHMTDDWMIYFEERLLRSKDRNLLIKGELKRFDYSNREIENRLKSEAINEGFDIAVSGHNPNVTDIIAFHCQPSEVTKSKLQKYLELIKDANESNAEIASKYIQEIDSIHYNCLANGIAKFRNVVFGFSYALYRERIKTLLSGTKKSSQNITGNPIIENKTVQKLKWKGKPAHLAFIIDLLIEKGYLDATPYGERTAEILLAIFEFEKNNPTKESLGRLLHKDKYPINDQTVINLFKKIPNRSELK